MSKESRKIITLNKKARHNFFVEDSYEAGISLSGTEVKSIRLGKINLNDAYCYISDGEMFVKGMHISPYEKGNIFNKDPLRDRKLLMHKYEILKIFGWIKQDSYTLIPLSLYFKDSKVKVEVGLCKGKKLHDKRDDMAQKDSKREIERYMKDKMRN